MLPKQIKTFLTKKRRFSLIADLAISTSWFNLLRSSPVLCFSKNISSYFINLLKASYFSYLIILLERILDKQTLIVALIPDEVTRINNSIK